MIKQMIQIDNKYIPYRWKETLIKNQKIGGVFLVFLSGENRAEIQKKVKLLKQFCKKIYMYGKNEKTK
jgi:hypothetical protein